MFITFEGIDGCGKSTQIKGIDGWLGGCGHAVIVTREPYGKGCKNGLERLGLLNRDRLAMLMHDRTYHVKNFIMPHLYSGCVILCDRFIDSTVAYQGYGDGLPIGMINHANRIATGGITPNLTIWLDVPVDVAIQRINRRGAIDRIESQGMPYLQRVIDGYRKLASQHPHRIYRVDGVGSADDVANRIQAIITDNLPFCI